jgi:hypothetical protein
VPADSAVVKTINDSPSVLRSRRTNSFIGKWRVSSILHEDRNAASTAV